MNYELLTALRSWRDEQARVEGVEGYRVLNNAALEEVARVLPYDKATLCQVKGIKEAKYRKYGKTLLSMIAACTESDSSNGVQRVLLNGESRIKNQEFLKEGGGDTESEAATPEPLSVSQFLDSLNIELSGMAARVRGEVSSVDIRERVVYFSLKDSQDESLVSCLIFRYQYEVSGVSLAIGDEVIVEGAPDVYKPSGRLSLKVGVIEYAGEGELKKAYDALYKKLEVAGAFSPERKRPIPELANHVALITSREGAAIGDFTMNLARAGMRVDFYPTLVEGKKAVFEIIEAIRYFNQTPEQHDVLVIVRGGGSLESLQAFNTEALVNEVMASSIPVLAGIGHERDVSLAALAADHMVSTPTATARYLSTSWDEARAKVVASEMALEHAVGNFRRLIEERLGRAEESIRQAIDGLTHWVVTAHSKFREAIALFPGHCQAIQLRLQNDMIGWRKQLEGALVRAHENLQTYTELLRQFDPLRALRLGYSIIRKGSQLVRSVNGLRVGDRIDIQLGQGRVESKVIRIAEE